MHVEQPLEKEKKKKDITTQSYLVLFVLQLVNIYVTFWPNNNRKKARFLTLFPFTLCTSHLHVLLRCFMLFFSLNNIHKTWENALFPEFFCCCNITLCWFSIRFSSCVKSANDGLVSGSLCQQFIMIWYLRRRSKSYIEWSLPHISCRHRDCQRHHQIPVVNTTAWLFLALSIQGNLNFV